MSESNELNRDLHYRGMNELVPEAQGNWQYQPWWQKALDYASLPARLAWREVMQPMGQLPFKIGEASQTALESPNLLQDPHAQYKLTEAMTDLGLTATGMPLKPAGSLGVFGGRTAAGADLSALARAEAMQMRAVHPQEIWEKTGWWRGPGGDWRFEIPDEAATFNMQNMIRTKDDPNRIWIGYGGPTLGLSDILNHPELFKNYPQLKNLEVGSLGIPDMLGMIKGSYSGSEGKLRLGIDNPEALMETLMHEVQHAVQHIEGFPKGGSSAQFLPQDFDKLHQGARDMAAPYMETLRNANINPYAVFDALDIQKTGGKLGSYHQKEYDGALGVLSRADLDNFWKHSKAVRDYDTIKNQAFERYEQLAGEMEARNVETRLRYGLEKRRELLPQTTFENQKSQGIERYTTGPVFRFVPVEENPFK